MTDIRQDLPRPESLPHYLPDPDAEETREWLDSLDGLVDQGGARRARQLLLHLVQRAAERQVDLPALRSTDYVNTIPPACEPEFPGDEDLERRIRRIVRWNAAVAVTRANRPEIGVGGHIATYQSAASLYEVGLNHFFRGKDHPGGGDQVFFQGHAAPGVYARAFLEGRLTADRLDGFRQELSRGGRGAGLPSYPHPRLMPDFWEFPTVSMGLGPINAIYQARFNRYLGRGFLLGATAGRTTLNGEGLQHEDGHSLLLAATNPGCVSYDPAFGFEVAHIVRDGLHRMYGPDPEDLWYYLTVYNEPYPQPAEPEGLDVEGLLRGLYLYAPAADPSGRPRAQVLASGVAMTWALEAQRRLAEEWGVAADVWSATSWTELAREAAGCERDNLRRPQEPARVPYVRQALDGRPGPVVAVSDWMRAVPDQIAPWVPGDWSTLGTDGFGCSDTRHALRRNFLVDAESIIVQVLRRLAATGDVAPELAGEAARRYRLDDTEYFPVGVSAGGES